MKCNQKNCDTEASERVFWPGREPSHMCPKHAEHARTIAECLGFHVVIEPERPEPK